MRGACFRFYDKFQASSLLNHINKCSFSIEHSSVDYSGIPEPKIANRKYLDGSSFSELPTTLPFANSQILKAFKVKDNSELSSVFQDISDLLERNLVNYGAILISNFNIDKHMFADFITSTNRTVFNYAGGNAAREEYDDAPGIMNATDDPAEVTIEPHLEMSYSKTMPARIYFTCENAPKIGEDGQTTICDKELVTKLLDKKIVGRLWTEGVRYHRFLPCGNVKKDYIYTWQKAFHTKTRVEAEYRATLLGYDVQWKANGTLSLSNVVPAVRNHPVTGKEIWCNQSAAANKTYYLDIPDMYKSHYSTEDVPGHTTFANGDEIPMPVLDHIRATTYKCNYGHSWTKGDLMVLDNCRVAHGRIGFPNKCKRKLHVALTN